MTHPTRIAAALFSVWFATVAFAQSPDGDASQLRDVRTVSARDWEVPMVQCGYDTDARPFGQGHSRGIDGAEGKVVISA